MVLYLHSLIGADVRLDKALGDDQFVHPSYGIVGELDRIIPSVFERRLSVKGNELLHELAVEHDGAGVGKQIDIVGHLVVIVF